MLELSQYQHQGIWLKQPQTQSLIQLILLVASKITLIFNLYYASLDCTFLGLTWQIVCLFKMIVQMIIWPERKKM